jgi:hypothetical protein
VRPPLLLLDVDGVINAFPPRGATLDPWGGEWRRTTVRGYPITTAEKCLAELRSLHETGAVDIRWLTTWESKDWYRELATALDLPDWPVYARQHRAPGWWKFHAVANLDAPPRPLVWLDDDLAAWPEARRWCAARELRVLGIAPSDRTGLTPENFDEVRRFIKRAALYAAPADEVAT